MHATDPRPHVVIIGGGFAGITAARTLAKADVRITLIDRTNHHLFQPLLYQVATAVLNPADITVPICARVVSATTIATVECRFTVGGLIGSKQANAQK